MSWPGTKTSVSKRHAMLTVDRVAAEILVTDLGSRNGTFVNGDALDPEAPFSLWPGARLGFGSALYLLVDGRTLGQLASLVS